MNTIPEEVPVPAETESGSSSSSDSSDVEKDGNEDDDEFDDKDVEKLNSLVTSVSLILLFIKYSLLKYNIEVNGCYILGRILYFRFYLSYLLSWGHGFLNFFFFRYFTCLYSFNESCNFHACLFICFCIIWSGVDFFGLLFCLIIAQIMIS